jgi:hypothetical protein
MRSIKILFAVFFLVAVCGVLQTHAQRTALSTAANFVVDGTGFHFDVYAQGGSTTPTNVRVGISQFVINTNRAGLSPIGMTLTNINPKYTGVLGTDDYDPMTLDTLTGAAFAGKVVVTIHYTGNSTGVAGLLSSTVGTPAGERICTVNMPVINGQLTAGLTWDQVNSAITDSRSQPVNNSFTGSNNGPLPVQLASFTAQINQTGGVRLNWATVTETNNYGFYAERRLSGTEMWSTVSDLVPGHGTTLEPHSYTFVDHSSLAPGTYQYRLRQVDLDGTTHFADPISITLGVTDVKEFAPREFALRQNYPNPFNPETIIKFSVENSARTTLDIYNTLGQKVATLFDDVAEAGQYYNVRLNGVNLASGTYIYRLQSGNRTDLKKMLLLK